MGGGKFYLLRIIIVGLSSLIMITIGYPSGLFHNFGTPLCALYTVSVYLVLLRVRMSENINRFILKFAKYTMAIYTLHPLFIQIVFIIWPIDMNMWFLQFLIYLIIVLGLSYITGFFIKKIPLFNDI